MLFAQQLGFMLVYVNVIISIQAFHIHKAFPSISIRLIYGMGGIGDLHILTSIYNLACDFEYQVCQPFPYHFLFTFPYCN